MMAEIDPPYRLKFIDIVQWGVPALQVHQLADVVNDRLKVWDILYNACLIYGNKMLHSDEYKEHVTKALNDSNNDIGILQIASMSGKEQAKNLEEYLHLDLTSCALIALACNFRGTYQENKLLVSKFIVQESHWLIYKYSHLKTSEEFSLFFTDNHLEEPKRIPHEWLVNNGYMKCLCDLYDLTDEEFHKQIFYAIRFENVPKLVKNNRVILFSGGIAMVPARLAYHAWMPPVYFKWRKICKAGSRLCNSFNSELVFEFIDKTRLKMINWMEKIKPSIGYNTQDSMDKISLCNLEKHVDKYFPPCAKSLHKQFIMNHHLKHFSRFQYFGFLRNAGLPLQQMKQFFRCQWEASGRSTEWWKYKKLVNYTIPWLWGLHGKKEPVQPQTCDGVIEEGCAANNLNGCPFQTFTSDQLRAALGPDVSDEQTVEEIVSEAKAKHYKQACTIYFEDKFEQEYPEKVINKPNDFYNCSVGLVEIEDLLRNKRTISPPESETSSEEEKEVVLVNTYNRRARKQVCVKKEETSWQSLPSTSYIKKEEKKEETSWQSLPSTSYIKKEEKKEGTSWQSLPSASYIKKEETYSSGQSLAKEKYIKEEMYSSDEN